MNCVWKEIENGFERKRRELENKTLRSCKILFLKTYQNFSLLFKLKSILETTSEFDLDHVLKSGLN